MSERISVSDIKVRKGGTPLVVLTAYSAPIAKLLDGHVDMLLVGDSVAMVLYGMENTRGADLEMMIRHGKAVVSHSSKALVVVDMPFGSYHESKEQALANAQRVLAETGAGAVKMEGGEEMAGTIAHLVKNGVAVMGHVGLMPQRVTKPKDYRYQGRTDEEAAAIMRDAKAIDDAGVFSIVIEAVREDIARQVSETVKAPTIGIGASPACDGQVLVIDDILGFSGEYVPSFAKSYAQLAPQISEAAKAYAAEVRERKFPTEKYYRSVLKKL